MKRNTLIVGDCQAAMRTDVADGSVDLVFADPPYNIGYNYGEGEYDDTLPADVYHNWSKQWIENSYRVLSPTGALWIAIGDEWAGDLKVIATKAGFHLRSWVIWYYTFGVNCVKKFNRSHTHLLYFVKHPRNFTFNSTSVRVPSARALVYNDKRASSDGRLPDDTWVIRPQDAPEMFKEDEDVWSIPRVCGTFKERIPGAATQLPEQLLGRIIRACSNEGDLVLDPMAGTGTTLVVAKKLARDYIGIERSPRFAEGIEQRLEATRAGDLLD